MHVAKHKYWSDLYPDGMTYQDIENELSDFADLIQSATLVYCHATGGKISKLNTKADVVIAVIDECTQAQIDDAIAEQMEKAGTND